MPSFSDSLEERSMSDCLRTRVQNARISSALSLMAQIFSTSGCSGASARKVMPKTVSGRVV